MKPQPAKAKILFVLQLPPPFHGASIANQQLINSSLISDLFDSRMIDLKTAATIDAIGRFSFKKLWVSLKIMVQILKQLIFYRPNLVYFTLAPSGFAFYRDAVYVFFIKLFRYKLVLHLHGKGFTQGIKTSHLFSVISKKIFRNSYTIHMSAKLTEDVPEFEIRQRFIVPYGVPVLNIEMPKSEQLLLNILFLSNYVKSKGIIDLIDAVPFVIKENPQFHVFLAGKEFDITEDELKEHIKSLKIENYVTVLGPRYGNDKYALLKQADIFVLPTFYSNEAFPISLLEAMQFGLAIISTDEGGIADMIKDNQTGLITEKRNPRMLAEKILELMNNVEKRRLLAINARKAFFEQYTSDAFERQLSNAFNQVLNDNKKKL